MLASLLEQPLLPILVILAITLFLCLHSQVTEFRAKQAGLLGSLLALFVAVLGCISFDKSTASFQYLARATFDSTYNLYFTLGADGLSMVFLILTLFVFPLLVLASWSGVRKARVFISYLVGMELLLVLTFTTTDLFSFYVLFESLLIPMFILIGVWGARERKLKAAFYFFLYTLFGSLFMLFGIIYLYFLAGSSNYFILTQTALDAQQQEIIWLCLFLAFAVKMPLFPLHIWLPEAHVEAPTVGSMLLASLLLKLGGYGFLRFSVPLTLGSMQYTPLVVLCSICGVIYGSLSTLRQIDLKRIIAYSSVAHMNLCMLGLFAYERQAVDGAVYLMVAHGVVSTALFFCVGVLYDRYHSRLLRYYGGLVTVMPLFSTAFFLFTLANMSFPGTSNFVGELLIFVGLFAKNNVTLLFATAGIVLSAAYSVWLFNRVVFGTLKTQYTTMFTDLTVRESTVFAALLLPMLVLGLASTPVLVFTQCAEC